MNLSIDSTSCHPCAALTAKFCVQQLEENGEYLFDVRIFVIDVN